MKCNLALWDRFIRIILALGLLTYAFAGGPTWMYVGLFPLLTAAWGFDPLYAFFGIRTIRYKKSKEESES